MQKKNDMFENLKKYFKSNKFFFVYVFIVTIFTHGSKLFLYSVTVDTETRYQIKNSLIGWIQQGRYGISLIDYLSGVDLYFTQYSSVFLAIFFLGLSAIIWNFTIQYSIGEIRSGKVEDYIFVSMFLTYPIIAEYFNFYQYNFQVSIGISVCALGVCTAMEAARIESKKYIILSIIFLTFALAIYQPFISLILSGASLILVIQLNLGKVKLLKIIKVYVITISSSSVLFFISMYTLKIFVPKNSYIEGSILWGQFDGKWVIINIINKISSVLWKNSTFTQICGFLYFLCIIIAFIYICIYSFKLNKYKLLNILFTFVFILSPFLMFVLLGNQPPIRTLLSIPLIISFTSYGLIAIIRKKRKILLTIMSICLLLIALRQGLIVNKLYLGDFIRYNHDYAMIQKISNGIDDLGLGEIPDKPIAIVGKYIPLTNATTLKFEVLGSSIFEWNNTYRNINFFNISGYPYKSADKDSINQIINNIKKMPNYPTKGYIQEFDQIIVIKLSDDLI